MYRVLEITTTAGCAVGCSYCPQDKFARAQLAVAKTAKLPLDLFKRCLETVPIEVDISFAGYSEPWLNLDCTTMVEYARSKGHGIRIFSTLVGMTEQDIKRLTRLSSKIFVVHAFDNGTFMKTRYVNNEYLTLVRLLVASRIPSLKFLTFGGVHPDLLECIPPELLVTTRKLISRGGSVNAAIVTPLQPVAGAIRCREERHYRNVLLPNGDVTLCCMDFERRHVIGNLTQSDYSELHSGNIFQQILRRLEGENGFLLCRTCEIAAKKESF